VSTTAAVREVPLPMTVPLAKGAWGGVKTVTRRPTLRCKPNIGDNLWVLTTWFHHTEKRNQNNEMAWDDVTKTVRWRTGQTMEDATPEFWDKKWWRKRPSIHMPRWASGMVYEVLDVSQEFLWDITEEEAKREGIRIPVTTNGCPPGKGKPLMNLFSPYLSTHDVKKEPDCHYRVQFAFDWDALYGKGPYAWSKNPRIWVISFRRARG